jgi:hypothetical protein
MTDPDHAQRKETAAVVLYWMQRRGMTRKVFADRMGQVAELGGQGPGRRSPT